MLKTLGLGGLSGRHRGMERVSCFGEQAPWLQGDRSLLSIPQTCTTLSFKVSLKPHKEHQKAPAAALLAEDNSAPARKSFLPVSKLRLHRERLRSAREPGRWMQTGRASPSVCPALRRRDAGARPRIPAPTGESCGPDSGKRSSAGHRPSVSPVPLGRAIRPASSGCARHAPALTAPCQTLYFLGDFCLSVSRRLPKHHIALKLTTVNGAKAGRR